MRRLLEWKQRMLQSPLNRKLQGNKGNYPRPNDSYHENPSGSFPPPQQQQQQQSFVRCNVPDPVMNERLHSKHPIAPYTSYSSDDEGKLKTCDILS